MNKSFVVSPHAKQRVVERCKDNTSKDLIHDMKIAYKNKNFLVSKNAAPGRATVYFSSNRKFLWKVVLSTETGAVITVLPLIWGDIEYAYEKGLLDKGERNE